VARLEVRGITVRFGGKVAVDEVSLAAEPGRITGLIGANGAGKTTLFNVITGLLAPDAGEVFLDGRELTRMPPYRRARLGLGRTFQQLELLGTMTVRENIAVAAETRRGWAHDGIRPARLVDEMLDRAGLSEFTSVRADTLPTGIARRVELARALATKPSVLLLDEPASGQTEAEIEKFGALLRELAGEGKTVVLVEHDVPLVMAVCDLVHVLDFGLIIAVGTPDEIRHDEKVITAYLGAPGAA